MSGPLFAERQLDVWFEPVIDAGFREVIGQECVVSRLDSHGFRSCGADLIRAARSSGEAVAFDLLSRALCMRAACAQIRRGSPAGPWFVSFLPEAIIEAAAFVAAASTETDVVGVDRPAIVFEAVLPAEPMKAGSLRRLISLRDLLLDAGFGFSISRLGTRDSLSADVAVIESLRPDFVKPDVNLVRQVETASAAEKLRNLLGAAESAQAILVAPGVERLVDVENLWLLGIEVMQGPHFGSPGPEPANQPRHSSHPDLRRLATAIGVASAPDAPVHHANIFVVPAGDVGN